jgi:hypothetical protein
MSTPPGWFPDPQQPGSVRWWDGTQWTSHAQPAGGQPGWYGTQPAAWAGQPYGAPAAPGWVTPAGAGQWGQTPQVYYGTGKKHGKRFWWTFAVIASVVVLAAGGSVGLLIVKAVKSIQAPQRQAEAYLGDLTHARYARAYTRLCPVDTAKVSLVRFVTAKAAAHPVSYRIEGTDVSTVNGVEVATVTFDETTSSGVDRTTQNVKLEHSSTGWYVCHRGVDPDVWAATPKAQDTGPSLPAAFTGRASAQPV